MSRVVIGVGNRWRGDDAAGLAVARRLRSLAGSRLTVREHSGDAVDLADAWAGAERVTIVDAASSGAPAGTIHRMDASARPLPTRLLRSSTHEFGVPDAIELARALGRLPARLEVYAIEGADFAPGDTLSAPVAGAVAAVAAELARTGQVSSAP